MDQLSGSGAKIIGWLNYGNRWLTTKPRRHIWKIYCFWLHNLSN